MSQLQELLLVQLVKKYGHNDFSRIATVLHKHPLLTSNSDTLSPWDSLQCEHAFDRILRQEKVNNVTRSTVTGADIATLFQTLHSRRIRDLKQQIRADEVEYATLKSRLNGDDAKVEVPSSTQETIDDRARTPVAPLTKKETTDAIIGSVPFEEGQAGIATASTIHETGGDTSAVVSTRGVNSAHAEASQVEDDQDPADSKAAATEECEATSPEVSEQPEAENETGSSSTMDEIMKDDQVDEIAMGFDTEMADSSLKLDLPSKLAQTAFQSRKTRTRSNTVNTTASTDTAINDDLAADQLLKKRGPRSARKSAARDDGKAPTMSSVVDDPDAATTLKKFQSTIIPVLNNIASHRYASVFANPVSDKEAPNYSSVVKQPMNIKTVRAQIKSGEISNVHTFHKSVVLMLSNAIMYNSEHGEVAKMALELFDHAEEVIAMFRAAEEMSEVADDRTPKRRRRND